MNVKRTLSKAAPSFFVLIYQKQNYRFLHFAENMISKKKTLTIFIYGIIIKYIIKLFNKVVNKVEI